MVQNLENLSQEIPKKLEDNNKSRRSFVERMIRQVKTIYLGIELTVDLSIHRWGIKETWKIDPYNCEMQETGRTEQKF